MISYNDISLFQIWSQREAGGFGSEKGQAETKTNEVSIHCLKQIKDMSIQEWNQSSGE